MAVLCIGTMFSMAVLAAMISIAIDMVIRVSAAFWTSALVDKYLLDPEGSVDMTSQALQQGGMGLIFTTLILTAPNGGDVLPGRAGWLHGIFADRR